MKSPEKLQFNVILRYSDDQLQFGQGDINTPEHRIRKAFQKFDRADSSLDLKVIKKRYDHIIQKTKNDKSFGNLP